MQDLNPLLLTPDLPGRQHIQTEAQGQWDERTAAEEADGRTEDHDVRRAHDRPGAGGTRCLKVQERWAEPV